MSEPSSISLQKNWRKKKHIEDRAASIAPHLLCEVGCRYFMTMRETRTNVHYPELLAPRWKGQLFNFNFLAFSPSSLAAISLFR
ncbi:MAG TPA: hypothetical protein VHC22_23750 [Pirellulales bacterium]|nr:hypothetical protein [Pirellulales bacterium]